MARKLIGTLLTETTIQVLAGLILAGLLSTWFHKIYSSLGWIQSSTAALLLVIFVGAIWLLVARYKKLSKPICSLSIERVEGRFHIAYLHLIIKNSSRRNLSINSIELKTEQQWDIPDLYHHAMTLELEQFLPKREPVTLISATQGSIASISISSVVPPHNKATYKFLLVTDHSPDFAVGLFIFLVSATLIYGSKSKRDYIGQFVAALHGKALGAMTEHKEKYLYGISRAEMQTRANAVLSSITEGVAYPPAIYERLRLIASGKAK